MPTANTRAGAVAYDEQGTGPALLLAHATLHDRRDYDPVVDRLSDRFRVIAFDWPWHGESPGVADQIASASLFADVLEDIVADLELPDVGLIGNSVGGYAAARLALTHPELVRSLVLVNSGGFGPFGAAPGAFCWLLGRPRVARRLLGSLVPMYMRSRTPNDRDVATRARQRSRTREGARTAAGLWRSFAASDYDLRGRATALTAPTLIVWGTKDKLLPRKVGRVASETIPGSQLVDLPVGHVVFSSDPDGFVTAVLPFLLASDARPLEPDAAAPPPVDG